MKKKYQASNFLHSNISCRMIPLSFDATDFNAIFEKTVFSALPVCAEL